LSGVDADADGKSLPALCGPSFIEILEAIKHLQRGLGGQQRMVLARCKRAPVGQDAVANKFIGDALVLEDHIRHLGEVFIEQREQFHGIAALSQSSEIANVREEDRQLALLASKIDAVEIIKNIVHQNKRDVPIEYAP